MRSSALLRRRLGAVLPAALIGAHAALGLWSIRRHGATFDEPALIASGYSCWRTGDLRMDAANPPLAKLLLSLPLLLQRIRFPADAQEWRGAHLPAFGERLFFWSGNDAGAMLLWPRALNLLLSALLALRVWRWARRRWGEDAARFSLALYCFCPTILAHATVATLDFPAACAVALSALEFADLSETPGRAPALRCALAGAAGVWSKFTALLLWPALAAALAWDLRFRPARAGHRLRLYGFRILASAAASFGLLLLLWPPARAGVALRLWQASHAAQPAFLLGAVSAQGWRWFYLVAVAVKSTLPELIVLGILMTLASRRRERADTAAIAALSVSLVYFLAASLSRKQLGIRYLLPAYPLLAASAGLAYRWLSRQPRGGLAALLLCLWQSASAAGVAPHFLSYFNEAAGGPGNGYRILADSNLDWGQDLPELADYLRAQGRPAVILSYFGTDSPERFGILAQQLASANAIQRRWRNPDRPERELLVVSATNLDGVYLRPPALLSWLKEREPIARIAFSLFVYDVSRDAEAHRRLAAAYAALGDSLLSARERRRAALIDREAPAPTAAGQP